MIAYQLAGRKSQVRTYKKSIDQRLGYPELGLYGTKNIVVEFWVTTEVPVVLAVCGRQVNL